MEFGFNALGAIHPESSLHAHCPEERAHLFHAYTGGAGEHEVLEFLHALVFLFKPHNVLETGTGAGFATYAMADAILRNGFGRLHTVDIDPAWTDRSRDLVRFHNAMLLEHVTFHSAPSLEWIASYSGPPFDFVFYDSLIAFRHLEYEALLERGLLTAKAVCVFHDTSRLRGQTMHDFNPDMISALDRYSEGKQWLESDLSRGLRMIKLG